MADGELSAGYPVAAQEPRRAPEHVSQNIRLLELKHADPLPSRLFVSVNWLIG